MISGTILNQVATLLNTTDKNLVISAIIDTIVAEGFSFRDAFDAVLGEGAYSNMAGSLYDAIRARA